MTNSNDSLNYFSLNYFDQSEDEKNLLIDELQQLGIKHTPSNILLISKLNHGKIIFLERGDNKSGLQHIIKNHQIEFAQKGISQKQIADIVFQAVLYNNIVGYQQPNRPIYQVMFNGKIHLIAVTVSDNGYIVCANPASMK